MSSDSSIMNPIIGRRLSIDPTIHTMNLETDFQPAKEGVDPFEQKQESSLEENPILLRSHSCCTVTDPEADELMAELGRLIKEVDLKHEMRSTMSNDETKKKHGHHKEIEKAKLKQIRRIILKSFNKKSRGGEITSPAHISVSKDRKPHKQQQPHQRKIFDTGYLPVTYSEKLIYLACLAENPKASPFEYYQKEAFRRAKKNSKRAAFLLGLPVALPVLIAFSGTACFIWLITDPIYGIPPTTSLIIVTIVSFIVTLAASLFSWFVTGIYPDKSSNAANARQNSTLDLKETYDELSYELVDLYKVHHTQARLLALLIDVNLIKYRARQAGADHWDCRKIFRLFESALAYIREGVLPRHHLLLHYILAPTLEGNVEREGLRERSASIGPNITRVIRQYLPKMSSSMADDSMQLANTVVIGAGDEPIVAHNPILNEEEAYQDGMV